ncbi:S-adenosyl-L-methionine-dependent methyltransferase [Echria macrotheca]|uniref:S-adenosyl-L-methionine-dependent methyltransferase n=1 Tax=Echria macrotheca TaxID=438768 RepID=A0AAJ0FCY5_9PEZI|nr:S-adenosyl-L-methionine-dependent methyltransferase [Echria macrotheca]
MWQLPEGDAEQWKQTFADPEDPTYEELLALRIFAKPGKQCSHPVSDWFRDARPNPPPLRPRHVILAEVLRENTAFDHRIESILNSYMLATGISTAQTPLEDELPSFPKFSLLPFEIREYIWRLSLSSRVLDVREVQNNGKYTNINSTILPVPTIARVCREAREVVMRHGRRIQIALPHRRGSKVMFCPAGFFLKGIDIPLFLLDVGTTDAVLDDAQAEDMASDGVPVLNLVANKMAPAMRCTAMASWVALKHAGPGVRVIYVYYRSRFLEVSLGMTEEFVNTADGVFNVEVQLLVDMHDDQRLAELSSLETIGEDRGNNTPRYLGFAARNPGLCINCDRIQWERHVRPAVMAHYLQLFEDELDDEMYRAVFPPTVTGYDPNHPWVMEKLKAAPEFRPAVLVHLLPTPPPRDTAAEHATMVYGQRVSAIRWSLTTASSECRVEWRDAGRTAPEALPGGIRAGLTDLLRPPFAFLLLHRFFVARRIVIAKPRKRHGPNSMADPETTEKTASEPVTPQATVAQQPPGASNSAAAARQTGPPPGTTVETTAPPEIRNQPENVGALPANEEDELYNDDASSTASLTASILEYRTIHGRTYHSAQGDAEYWGANDDAQNEALDIIHHVLTLTLDGKLCKAPISDEVQKVLDVGTGTGLWAIDFGDKYPSAEVIGTDLSPIQPNWVPPNVNFQIDDCTQEWTFAENSFDFIHIRWLFGSIKDWDELYRQAYRALKPGGWIESHEASVQFRSDDGTVTDKTAMGRFGQFFIDGGKSMGRSMTVVEDGLQRKGIEAAGFVNVQEENIKSPFGPWPKDPKLREIGNFQRLATSNDLAGSMMYLGHLTGWSPEEVQVYAANLRREFRSPRIHAYYLQKIVWAQKPE